METRKVVVFNRRDKSCQQSVMVFSLNHFIQRIILKNLVVLFLCNFPDISRQEIAFEEVAITKGSHLIERAFAHKNLKWKWLYLQTKVKSELPNFFKSNKYFFVLPKNSNIFRTYCKKANFYLTIFKGSIFFLIFHIRLVSFICATCWKTINLLTRPRAVVH